MNSTQPTRDEVFEALNAGFETIDEGAGFYPGFNATLAGKGYRRLPDAPCICSDQGQHGHLPECGWLRDRESRR